RAAFTVTLTHPSESTITVNYATANGTAQAGSDYVQASGTLTFAPDETSHTITVLVPDDTTEELDKTFVMNLSSPAYATLSRSPAEGKIIDDDAPTISVSNDTTTEGGTLMFTVSLSKASIQPISMTYATANGTA